MRVEYRELFDPIVNAVALGNYEFLMSDIRFKITCDQEILSFYLNDRKIADIPCNKDFETLRQVQGQVYNLINLALYMHK